MGGFCGRNILVLSTFPCVVEKYTFLGTIGSSISGILEEK